MVKEICLPVQETQETPVRTLSWEDTLEKEMQPTPVFSPVKSHGQRSLAGYGSLGHKELDATEVTEHTPRG